MMRPSTTGKNKSTRPSTGATKEARGGPDMGDMMVSGKELGGHFGVGGTSGYSTSNKHLPPYKSIKMNIGNGDDGKDE